jgi:hypothetical protein
MFGLIAGQPLNMSQNKMHCRFAYYLFCVKTREPDTNRGKMVSEKEGEAKFSESDVSFVSAG